MPNQQTHFSIDEVISQEHISSAVINNIGDRIAYLRTSTDWNKNRYLSKIWIYDVITKKHSQLIDNSSNIENSPLWSPDGSNLAFISQKLDESYNKAQIFVYDFKTEQSVQITNATDDVEQFIWATDGKGFYYLASQEYKKIQDREKIYGSFQIIDQDKQNNSLYFQPFNASAKQLLEMLTDGNDFHIYAMAASPDNTKLAFTTAPTSAPNDWCKMKFMILDLASKRIEVICDGYFIGGIVFSPDSNEICYCIELHTLKNHICEIFNLTSKEFNRPNFGIDESIYPFQWTNKGIYFSYWKKTENLIGLLDNHGKVQPVLDATSCYIENFHISDKQQFVHIEIKPGNLPELYFNGIKITHFTQEISNKILPDKQIVKWQSSDGVEIEGVLSIPKDFNPAQKYPLLIILHGGGGISVNIPFSNMIYPIESFVAKGFITLEPNYRGSAGYGEKFKTLAYKNFGIGDYEDVISGVDDLIKRGFVQTDKIGIMGWSHGGYLASLSGNKSNKFKAVSVCSVVSSWATWYFTTDIPYCVPECFGVLPYSDKDIYQNNTPMAYLKSARTPTLIQHGKEDSRSALANAYELYRGLKDMKVETKLVIFDNMQHDPENPKLLRAINQQNLNWFCHYLLGEPLNSQIV